MEVDNVPFDPCEDRLVVMPLDKIVVTAAGLELPKSVTDKEKPIIGKVLAVGPGKITDYGVRVPVQEPVMIGKWITFPKNVAKPLKIDPNEKVKRKDSAGELYVVRERDVLVVWRDKAAEQFENQMNPAKEENKE